LRWPGPGGSDILQASKTDEEDAVGRLPLPLATHAGVLSIAQPRGQIKARAEDEKLELPAKRIPPGAAPDDVASRHVLADPTSRDTFVQLASTRRTS
jgi:hypothetical protein